MSTSHPGPLPVGTTAAYPGAVSVAVEGAPVLPRRVSWGGILAGALVAVAVGATLNILGFAVGATTVDTIARETPNASTLGIAASVWFMASNLIGLGVGAYVAARLSGTADKRDAALHGISTWAVAWLVSAVLLGNVASGLTNAATSAVGHVASGLGTAASAAAQAASNAAPTPDPRALVERARLALSGPSDPARMTTEQRGAEIASLVGRRVADGNLPENDRRRLNALVAAEAGIPEEEAANRVRSYEQEAQRVAAETEQRAREAADAAATAAATGAFWIFAGLLLGAIVSVLGARAGTRQELAVGTRYA